MSDIYEGVRHSTNVFGDWSVKLFLSPIRLSPRKKGVQMFGYYENGKRERLTMRKVYRLYCVVVDAAEKAMGTDFTAWLMDMQRMGLLNRL